MDVTFAAREGRRHAHAVPVAQRHLAPAGLCRHHASSLAPWGELCGVAEWWINTHPTPEPLPALGGRLETVEASPISGRGVWSDPPLKGPLRRWGWDGDSKLCSSEIKVEGAEGAVPVSLPCRYRNNQLLCLGEPIIFPSMVVHKAVKISA